MVIEFSTELGQQDELKAKSMHGISVVIPTYNEEHTIESLIKRIHVALQSRGIPYEIIVVDDNSTDRTIELVKDLCTRYPLFVIEKQNQPKGKAISLLTGFNSANYSLIGMIDADLEYPPEALLEMFEKIRHGADLVIAARKHKNRSFVRKFVSGVFHRLFVKNLHGLDVDVQSGLKLFKSEIFHRIELHPTPWTFDLELVIKTLHAGYVIDEVEIPFTQREYGQSKINLFQSSWEIGMHAILLKLKPSETIPFLAVQHAKEGRGFHYKGAKYVPHNQLHHRETALYRLTHSQKLFLLIAGFALVALFVVNWHSALVFFIAMLTVVYFIDLLFNLFLIYRSFSKPPEIEVSKDEIDGIRNSEWPMYSIFCPLYKEHEVIPQFVNAMNALDYPKDKMQIMLLLEENDQETIEAARNFNLPPNFEIYTVPHSLPKTKPKACNYGLKYARGEYTVIYDAEDVPDRDQLKKAVIAYTKAGSNVACIQAKLNFYNPHQNILTKAFTAEYSLWFDLVLTGLQSINAPIPLGGTSNHFRTQQLVDFKGWDAFNVTEDCDLGMRLVKRGYKTAVLNSTTLEEANSDFGNWLRQRSRWIKGYIQSYFVHMRNPSEMLRQWNEPHFITFQLIVGGKVLSMFINPFMWLITISYFMFRATLGETIESFFPPVIFYMALTSLVIGNFLYLYYYMIGCAKRGHDELIKYAFLIPIYWLMMSLAAWIALYEFLVKPHHWQKTKHGLHLNNRRAMAQYQNSVHKRAENTNGKGSS
jgi:cellulose synthase/poly-beta-1,6-N-acetylglucosamine synthase-like glycosyltransferase